MGLLLNCGGRSARARSIRRSASTVSPAMARWPIDTRAERLRQIDIDAAAEADEAEALAGEQPVALVDELHDAAGHQAGDLDDAELAAVVELER